KYANRNGKPVPRLAASVVRRLAHYPWPGNVRQLEHVIERAVILGREEISDIDLPEVDPEAPTGDPLPALGVSLPDALAAEERRLIIAALKEAGGVQAQAARRLGLSRSNLNYRIQRLGIQQTELDYS
ncbi:MAG: sigma-54-dependent Fis family transcriptional regulator, partial [Deltaproteobacteria bacterium]|nr:sigma-54-dependent Fis family transcriptional regulator [Deltaproteobacteria bacterium]